MNNPLLLFLIPCSFLISLIVSFFIKKIIPIKKAVIVFTICIALVSPLVFTDFKYGDIYKNTFVIASVLTVINYLWMQYVDVRDKIIASILLFIIAFIPTAFIFFGRSFVGEPTIYYIGNFKNYRVKYLRESSPGIREVPQIELYKTILFGLLEKNIDTRYEGDGSGCDIILTDNNKRIVYNICDQKIVIP